MAGPDIWQRGDIELCRDKSSMVRECDKLAPRTRALALLLVAGLLTSGCGGSGGGGSGGGSGGGGDTGGSYGGGGGGDDSAAIEPTLASIQQNVFTPVCTECHAGASAPEGLRLEDGVSHGMLVNVASSQVPELMRVKPGDPDNSYLIQKLEGTNAVGQRMPLGGPYLSADTMAAIRQWITDGAMAARPDASASKGQISAAWPVQDASMSRPPREIVLIADTELDTSLLHPGSVRIFNLDQIDAVSLQPQQLKNIRVNVSSLSPTVLQLVVEDQTEWRAGRHEVRVNGSGPSAVTDRSGRLIDGDADGSRGGDFVLQFDVEAVQ